MMFEKTGLDHIGIAVKDLKETIQVYEALGLHCSGIEEVPTEKVRVAFFQVDQSSRVELLEPTSKESVIHQYLEKKGPGIHHLCFRVLNLEESMKELSKKGMRFIYESPRPGAHGCLVNFIHPKSTGGVLIELSQKKHVD